MNKSLITVSSILFITISCPALAHQRNEQATSALFSQLDVNNNGYLSKEELREGSDIARWLSISSYGGFELADVNGDGKVGRVEFAEFEEDLPVE